MTDHDPAGDERLLDELKGALGQADPVPDDVLAAAKASFTWRTVDAELVQIQFDSAIDEMAGVRGEAGERQLTFRGGGTEIEVMVQGGRRRRLIGQIVPPQSAAVELRTEEGVRSTSADEAGAFQFTDVPPGPATLRCALADGTTIATEATIL